MVTSSQPNSSQSGLEERFSHLLQPIRDLAKNWDVDIAHFLEEYLDDLEQIDITFNNGATTMNFSEAALLIQGSAGVYAKKVEYLHSLVYQVLDLITQKKKAKSTENGEGGGDDDDCNNDDDDQFLPLDDLGDGLDGSYLTEKDGASNKSVRVVPEMPTRLIPLEESEKGDNTLYTKKGEVMGNHCDFNMNTGVISSCGSILLELGDRVFLGPAAVMASQALCTIEETEDTDGFAQDSGLCGESAGDEVDGGEVAVDQCGDDGDGDNIAEPSEDAAGADQPIRKSQRKVVTFARPASRPKSIKDPWAQLDPYEPSKAVEKPLVKKKTYKLPPGLEDNTSKKRKLKKEIKQELPPLHELVEEKMFSNKMKFPKNPIKVPAFPELEGAFWEEHKLRESIKKEEIKMLKKEEREEIEQLEEGEEGEIEEQRDDDNFDNDFGGGDDEDIPALQLDPDLSSRTSLGKTGGFTTDTGYQTGFRTGCDDITISYEDLVQQYVERFWASAAEFAQITDLSKRVAEWEEKIKPRLEEEESHEHFDIHTYGTFIISQCIRGQSVAFRDIVKGKQDYEICRYLLATLQLANVYNVELSLQPDKLSKSSDNIMDCLHVKLLSTKRHFEQLEEYTAPSNTEA